MRFPPMRKRVRFHSTIPFECYDCCHLGCQGEKVEDALRVVLSRELGHQGHVEEMARIEEELHPF